MKEELKYFQYEGTPSTEFAWEKIRYIGELLKAEKKSEKEEKKKKKEKTRKINVPLNMCKDINEMLPCHEIDYMGFYETIIDDKLYIIDIYKTTDMKFFVRITNIDGDKYEVIDFNEFKKKHSQPNLFNFFDI